MTVCSSLNMDRLVLGLVSLPLAGREAFCMQRAVAPTGYAPGVAGPRRKEDVMNPPTAPNPLTIPVWDWSHRDVTLTCCVRNKLNLISWEGEGRQLFSPHLSASVSRFDRASGKHCTAGVACSRGVQPSAVQRSS